MAVEYHLGRLVDRVRTQHIQFLLDRARYLMTVDIISEWKQWLLAYKPSSSVQHGDIEQFLHCFKDIRCILTDSGANDKDRVKCVDVMSILMLKEYQILKKSGKDADNEFVSNIKDKMITIEEGTYLFHYVIDFWTDNTVSMEIPLKNMFEKLLQLMNHIYGQKIMKTVLHQWIKTLISLEDKMKVQYYFLDAFSGQIDLMVLLQWKPNFVEVCFGLVWAEALCTQVGKCLSNVLLNWYKYHFDESSMEKWLDLWKHICCTYLKDPKYTKNIQLYVLSNVFKQLPASFGVFISDHEDFSNAILLSLLKIGQELAIEEEPFHNEKYIKMKDIFSLLQQDKYKLATFELLTYSNKKSKQIQPYIYDILKDNLTIFFVDYTLQTRNYFCSSLKSFINRIRDSTYSLNRDAMKLKQKNKFPEEQLYKQEHVKLAEDFMKWLVTFLKTQMAPGSQYQRKSLAYQVVTNLLVSGIDSSVPEKFLDTKQRMSYPFNINIFDSTLIRILIDDLTNNYDDIREHSLNLLLIAFSTSGRSNLNIDESTMFGLALDMLLSYKTSDGGAKIMEFVFIVSDNKYKLLRSLMDNLEQLLKEARSNLIENINLPVSGIFTALSLVITRCNKEEANKEILQRLIDTILLNWENVREIVCHDSPEGNLPIKYLKCGISDQIITSYAFRSIKESSALLKTILVRDSLTIVQIEQCGQILLDQLSHIRHSGAFQSVFPTYVQLCQCARKAYPQLLQVWLEESVSSLRTKSQYVTRRSGGLPFMISAILSSETDQERPLLQSTFEQLFEIASTPILKHEEKLDLPQVHAFNCIRSIFNESKLSLHSAPYVQKTLELCLKNFSSPLWCMRNCSVMLFTSLQNRLFGKMGKTMSARLFFTRFKGIREVLLATLRDSIELFGEKKSAGITIDTNDDIPSYQANIESIFLIFTILGRLKPTLSYDGLNEFEVEIVKALGCPNWKIRELAARTYASLVQNHKEKAYELLSLLTNSPCSEDKIHGFMLAIKELVLRSLEEASPMSLEVIGQLLNNNYALFISEHSCYAISQKYVEISELLLATGAFSEYDKRSILNILGNAFIRENSGYVVDGSKQLFLASVTRVLLQFENAESVCDILELALCSPFFEVQCSALQSLDYDILSPTEQLSVVNSLVEILEDTNQWVQVKADALSALQKSPVRVRLSNYETLVSQKSEILQSSLLENIASFEKVPESKFWDLVDKYSGDERPDQLRLAATKCLINTYNNCSDAKVLFRLYLQLFDESPEIREMSARFLNEHIFELQPFELDSSSYSTSLRCVELIPKLPLASKLYPILIDHLQKLYGGLKVTESGNLAENHDLFDVEKDNQYRNELELGKQIIQMLQNMEYNIPEETVEQVKDCLSELISNMDSKGRDGFLKWGSNPDIFNKLALQRYLLRSCGKDLSEIDDNLRQLNCHPLLFEI